MQREKLMFVATCDLSGQVRGKAFPLVDLPQRRDKGVGYTHTNIMMSAFGPAYQTPFGTAGDLMLVPDLEADVNVPFEDIDERFCLGDLLTLAGEPWECCPRSFLKRSLEALRHETGLSVLAAFEQEFVYTGVEDRPSATYGLDLYRRQGVFGEMLMGALREAGATPDSFMAEYGARQFELTVAPKPGLRAADEAVMVRELARAVAHRLGHRAIFAPMQKPDGIGSGTHIHFSLLDPKGRPAMPDPAGNSGFSAAGEAFVAGVLHYLPVLAAITAPSVASYFRLTPNRWAPTWVNLLEGDRGAALRICPVFMPKSPQDAAAKFNVEYRVADATASPYMALGIIIQAGLEGIAAGLRLPPALPASFWGMSDVERLAMGAKQLPGSLEAALELLESSEAARRWLGPKLHAVYLQLKRSEIGALAGAGAVEICERYVEAY